MALSEQIAALTFSQSNSQFEPNDSNWHQMQLPILHLVQEYANTGALERAFII